MRNGILLMSQLQDIAVEGLAESFAASLYGEEYIGSWVTDVKGLDLEKSREIIGKSLYVR